MASDGDIDLYGDTGEGDDLQQETHYDDERFDDDIGTTDHKTDVRKAHSCQLDH